MLKNETKHCDATKCCRTCFARITRLLPPPRSTFAGQHFPLSVGTQMNKDVGEWRQSVSKVSDFLREKGQDCEASSKCYSWQVSWTGLSLSRDGGAGQCASRHAIKIYVWLRRKEGKRQSLVDIVAILNHILEIWPTELPGCIYFYISTTCHRSLMCTFYGLLSNKVPQWRQGSPGCQEGLDWFSCNQMFVVRP